MKLGIYKIYIEKSRCDYFMIEEFDLILQKRNLYDADFG